MVYFVRKAFFENKLTWKFDPQLILTTKPPETWGVKSRLKDNDEDFSKYLPFCDNGGVIWKAWILNLAVRTSILVLGSLIVLSWPIFHFETTEEDDCFTSWILLWDLALDLRSLIDCDRNRSLQNWLDTRHQQPWTPSGRKCSRWRWPFLKILKS